MNLARTEGVVALADSQHRDRWGVDGWHAAYACDGRTGVGIANCWASDNWEVTHTLALLFPRQARVTGVAVHWGGFSSVLTPAKVRVEGLVGGKWQELAVLTPPAGEETTKAAFAPVTVAAVRLVQAPDGASSDADRRLWVGELEVTGEAVGPDVDTAALQAQLAAESRRLRLTENDRRVAPQLAVAMQTPKPRGFMALIDREDLARGRQNAATRPWAKTVAAGIIRDADWWVGKSDDYIYNLIPTGNPRAVCPSFEKGCPLHGGARGTYTATLEAPYRWRCSRGGELWHDGAVVKNPGTGEDVTVRDDGNGWLAPAGFPGAGRRFYFVAAYRYFVFGKLFATPYEGDGGSEYRGGIPVVQLAYAYALNGDAKYAHKCAVMLNRLAEVYRFLDGTVEGPSQRQDGYIGQTFERFLVQNLTLACDLIWDEVGKDAELAQFFAAKGAADYNGDGQATPADLTYNLQRNLLGYIYEYVHRCMPYFDGDFIMYEMTALAAVGACLGNPDIVAEALETDVGLRVLLTNSWYRDGKFIYDSTGYNVGNAETPLKIAEWLQGFAAAPRYPQPLDLYTDPQYRMSMLYDFLRYIYCDGRLPSIGDMGGPRTQAVQSAPPYRALDEQALVRLPETRDYYLGRLQAAAGGKLESFREGRADPWLVFHAGPAPADVPPDQTQPTPPTSHLFDDSGIALLRAGANPETREHLCFTYSKGSYAHGHGDKLALNVFRYGFDLTADLGYPTTWTDIKTSGWETNTASHCTVMLDERPQQMSTVGTLHMYATTPLADVVEASQEVCYPDSTLYRRTVALVRDEVGEPLYACDVFRVAGAKTRDYLFHSLGKPEDMTVDLDDGAATWVKQDKGSLAGEDVAPMTKGAYGFLFGVQRAATAGGATATWRPTTGTSQPDRYLLTRRSFTNCTVDFTVTRTGKASGPQERAVFIFATDPSNVNSRRVIMLPVDQFPVGQAVPVQVKVTGAQAQMLMNGQPVGRAESAGSPGASGSLGFLHYYNYAWDYRDLVITPEGGQPLRVDLALPLSADFWARNDGTYATVGGVLQARDSQPVQLRLHMLGAPGREIIRAQAEGYGVRGTAPLEGHLIVRDRPAAPTQPTAFVAVIEAFQRDAVVTKVEALPVTPAGAADAVAVRVTTTDAQGRARTDVVVSALDPAVARTIDTGGGSLDFRGRFGLLRSREGRPVGMSLAGGGSFRCGGKRLDLPGDLRARITALKPETDSVVVQLAPGSPAPDAKWVGRKLMIRGAGYQGVAVYTLMGVTKVGTGWRLKLNLPLLIARGKVGSVDAGAGTFGSETPVMKLSVTPKLFDGKTVRAGTKGQWLRLKSATREAFQPADPQALKQFSPGTEYYVYDLGPGDEVTMLSAGAVAF